MSSDEMANFRDLPVEITTEILKQAWEASLTTQYNFPSPELLIAAGLKPSYKPILVGHYSLQESTLFAFKAARVCSLWRDIVSTWRNAWDLVVFDLQDDPSPLRNVFAWSGDRPILVYIFNSKFESSPGLNEFTNEARRVMMIFQLLLPHVNRCQSIRFDVTFPLSLPPPVYFFIFGSITLQTLNLETFVPGDPVKFPHYMTPSSFGPFPQLTQLSLTGFAIIELGWDFPEWVRALEGGPRLDSLKISNFIFSSEISDDPMGEPGQKTVQFFVSMLSRIQPKQLHLVGMSISSDSTPRTISNPYDLGDTYFHFDTSSGPFLVEFLSWTQGRVYHSLEITKCGIIPTHLDIPLCGSRLTLRGISDSSSLRTVLANFRGATLTLEGCPGFDDTLIKWLSQPDGIQCADGDAFAAKSMNHIRIRNCTNFTSNALRRLIAARYRASPRSNQVPTSTDVKEIYCLDVTGLAPVLKPKDQFWFAMNPDVVEVCWYREEPDGLSMHMFDNYMED